MSRYHLVIEHQALPKEYPNLPRGMTGYYLQVRDRIEQEDCDVGFLGPMGLLEDAAGPGFDRLCAWMADAVLAQAGQDPDGSGAQLLEAAFCDMPLVFWRPTTAAAVQSRPWPGGSLEAWAKRARAETRAQALDDTLPTRPEAARARM